MADGSFSADGQIRPLPTDPAREEAFLPTRVPEAHASFLLELDTGDLLCAWFAGSQEGKPDVSIYVSRLPRGADTWQQEVKLSGDDSRSEQNPVLFQAPSGELWLLYTAQEFGNQDTSIVRRRISSDNGESWGPIEDVFDDVGLFIRQPIVVLDSGEWLLPAFHCRPTEGESWGGQNDISAVKISTDQGKTWDEAPVPGSDGAVHMNIVERSDGTLLGLFRSRYADHIKQSVSSDRGRSWSEPEPTGLPNNNSSIMCRKLGDGTFALVFNNLRASEAARAQNGAGPLWGAPRSPLTIALSEDEGYSWPYMRDIEVAPGPMPDLNTDKADRHARELSYPTVTGTADGKIAVAFTYFRQAIKFVRFDADWVRQG